MMQQKPSFYAVLPANVRYDKNLKPMEKIMFAEITALTESNGYCHAGNGYFSELYDATNETVSRWVSNLKKQGYIEVIINYKKDTKQIESRFITLLTKISIPPRQKDQDPIDQKVKENTTSINNNNIYISDFPNLNITAWEEFEQHRKTMKPALTDLARQKLMKKITFLPPEQQQECIDLSIENGWKGLFPDKQSTENKNGSYSKQAVSGKPNSSAARHHERNKQAYAEAVKREALEREQSDQTVQPVSSEIYPQVVISH